MTQVKKTEDKSVTSLIKSDSFKQRCAEVLGSKAQQYIASLISLVNQTASLETCEPNSVAMAAMTAATLDLPVNSNLSFAHIIPYNSKQKDGTYKKFAQFQMGWRGFVQLAMRTGRYETINVTEVYANQYKGMDVLSGQILLNNVEGEGEIIGYLAHFRLIPADGQSIGYWKTLYMNIAQLHEHGKKYSKTYHQDGSKWKVDFPSMAKKTVIKLLLSRWGLLSIEMRIAVLTDQAIIKNADATDLAFPDNPKTEDVTHTVVGEDEEKHNEAIKSPDEITKIKSLNL